MQLSLQAVRDEGSRAAGACCSSVERPVWVSGKEFPCLALLQYLCEKQAARCCPTSETEAMQASQLVKQGRSKGCFLPASFCRVFSLHCQVSLYLARFYAIVYLILFRVLDVDCRWMARLVGRVMEGEEPPAKQQPQGSQEGDLSRGRRKEHVLAGGCACCRWFTTDSLGTHHKLNSPFSQSKPPCLQHSLGKAVLCLRKLLGAGMH